MKQRLPSILLKYFLFLVVLANNKTTIAQQQFTSGNLVVLNVNNTNGASLLEYTAGGANVQTINVSSTGVTALTISFTASSEGALSRTSNGQYLGFVGYRTGTNGSGTDRVIARVSPDGTVNTTTAIPNSEGYTANNIRAAIFNDNGSLYWSSGNGSGTSGGVRTNSFGTTSGSTSVSTSVTNTRVISIFNGQLSVSAASGTFQGISAVGTGLPTTSGNTITQLPGFPVTSGPSPFGFAINAAGTIIYVADDRSSASGGIQKWTYNGSSWSLQYTLNPGTNIGARGLAVDWSGANPLIYATTTETSSNRLVKVIDAGSGSSFTTLATAPLNNIFRGVAFAPVASVAPPSVNLFVSTGNASEAAATIVTVTATASQPVSGDQSVSLNVSGSNITSTDYNLSSSTITIPDGASTGSVTFTINDDADIEGTETATLTISNPTPGIVLGSNTSQNVTITDNDFANNSPTISINVAQTTDFIDGGVNTPPASPFVASGVIDDPTDPASLYGIVFSVNDVETAASDLNVTASSSNTAVVSNANVTVSGTGASRTVKIIPTGVGYSNITVSVSDGVNTTSFIIKYAASAASLTPAATLWHTGMSDASDAIALDDDYYVTGDNELDVLNVYSRTASGLSLVSFDYSSFLSLPDPSKPEVHVEAATRSTSVANRVYWLGSMSNGKSPYDNKPNRDRLFATTVTGTGASTTFSVVGYTAIRSSLIAWGDANGYDFSSSAAAGVDPKTPAGFAAEGMVFGPDGSTLYIGLRAPLVPTANRTKAVIAPILNFEVWFNNGNPTGNPTYGSPVELDLGGKGIRDIIKLSNGTYIIIAGNPDSDLTPAIYKWTGNAADAPIYVSSPASDDLNMEGVMQVNTNGNLSLSKLQVISDGGSEVLYNDGKEAKDLNDLILRKFRSDNLSNLDLGMPTTGDTTAFACGSFTWYGTTYTQSITATHVFTNMAGSDSVVTLHLTIGQPTSSSKSVTVCNNYTWNGVTYTTSGNYTYQTTNAAGCDSVATLHLTINKPSFTITGGTINCNGDRATITINATGGTTPYMYSFNNKPFKLTNTFSNIRAGTYAIVVLEASGCSTSQQYTVTQPTVVKVTATKTKISCKGGGDGAIQVNATGGTPGYTYNINNGSYGSSNTFSGLSAGTYTVSAKDANGCSKSIAVTLRDGLGRCNSPMAKQQQSQYQITANTLFKVKVLPNPSATTFTLLIESADSGDIKVFVTDMYGKKVYQQSGNAKAGFNFGENFASGLYLVKVMQGRNIQTIKVLKSK